MMNAHGSKLTAALKCYCLHEFTNLIFLTGNLIGHLISGALSDTCSKTKRGYDKYAFSG